VRFRRLVRGWPQGRATQKGDRLITLRRVPAVYLKVSMPNRSERPTTPPSFDVAQFAKDSDARLRGVASAAELPSSETRLITRPQMGATITDQAWARKMIGAPTVIMAPGQLRRLPLDHRAGFLMSLMDGTIDLQTMIELSGMHPDEALRFVRDLYEAGIVVFR
jgi:hypothetical protein